MDEKVAKETQTSDSEQQASIDLSQSLMRLRGDRQLLLDMIGFYQDDYPKLIAQIQELTAAGDLPGVQRAAHSLKGLAATFDAEKVVAAACEVEFAARDANVEPLSSLIECLMREAHQLSDRLAHYAGP